MPKTNDSNITNLEKLFTEVRSFRSSKYYRDMLNMCAKFKHLSPYNVMLINMQKPLSRYVLKEQDWKRKFHRRIKPNAQPLIILVPFGPIDYLFEIGDTEPDDTFPMSDDEILETIARPFKTRYEVRDNQLKDLMLGCAYHGITFDMTMNAGVDYGADIRLLKQSATNKNVKLKKECFLDLPAPYMISVNKAASRGEQFAAIVHELGHFFCHHLPAPDGWEPWDVRHLPHNAEEFEAESVAWLICERLNIGNPSAAYLSGYLDEFNEIPGQVSVEAIFNSFNEVWNICSKESNVKKSLLYKRDKKTKLKIDKAMNPKKPTTKNRPKLQVF